ncbi:MAG: hypothetical protein LBH98_05985 [Chitinispirillales bacterium]|jgi:hypothetical protein|nr:hypothetical protein [Chitinispirillales bacterium]
MRNKLKTVNYTDKEYNDKNLELWDNASTLLWYNFGEEIRQRRSFWEKDLNNRARNREVCQGKILEEKWVRSFKDLGISTVQRNLTSTWIQNLTDNINRAAFHGHVKTILNQENAVEAATLDLLLKGLKNDISYDYYRRELVKVGLSEGFFPFLKVDIVDTDISNGRIKLNLYQPDAVLPSQKRYISCDDVDDIILIDIIKNNDLYVMFDDKKEIIDDYMSMWDNNYINSVTKRQIMISREELNKRFDYLKTSPIGSNLSNRDYTALFTWLRKEVADVNALIDLTSNNEIILTPEWTQEDIDDFKTFNPTYELVKRTRYVVWETIMTDRGIILRNRMHPIQIPTTQRDVTLPGVCYVPQFVGNKPECFTDIVKEDLNFKAITDTLGQEQIFMSGGKTLFAEQGAFDDTTNNNTLRQQLTSRMGIVTLTEGSINRYKMEEQKPNESMLRYGDETYNRIMEYAGITQEIQGKMQAAQSNYRAAMAIRQSLSSKSSYVQSLNVIDVKLTNILLYLFCMTTTDEEVYILTDDRTNTEKEVEVNKIERDKAGRIIRTRDNLRLGKFKYYVTQQSSSSLDDDINEEAANEFWINNGSTLLNMFQENPELVAMFLKGKSNPQLKMEGEMLEIQIEAQKNQQAQQAQIPGAAQEGMQGLQDAIPQGQIPQVNSEGDNEDIADESQENSINSNIEPQSPNMYDDYINKEFGLNQKMIGE